MLNNLLIMGSAEGQHEKQNVPMADRDKLSIKNILMKPFKGIFKKEKKKEKKQEIKETPASVLLDNFKNLEIKEEDELANFSYRDIKDEDELANFSYTDIKEERTPARTESHSSEDSGYSEKAQEDNKEEGYSDKAKEDGHSEKPQVDGIEDGHSEKVYVDDKEDQLIQSMKDLEVTNDVKKKKKKVQIVYISRAPTKTKVVDSRSSVHPYTSPETVDKKYREINHVNKQILSGGHVITKRTAAEYQPDITTVLKRIDQDVQNFQQNSEQDRERDWLVAMEFLEKTEKKDILQGFPEDEISQEFNVINTYPTVEPEPNPIEEFSTANHAAYEQLTDLELESITDYIDDTRNVKSIFPTPPRSESMTSPISDAYNTLSPELSPLYNSDNEKYQDIYETNDIPKCVTNLGFDRTKKKRTSSIMTLKQYKDLQKEIITVFAMKLCCENNKKNCKEIFLEHIEKLKREDRKDLCMKVANLDLKTAYGVLHHILLSLSCSDKEVDLQMSLFSLICERVMAQNSVLFLGDFGLSLIKSAALRCYKRPILTRYLVQCVRTALKCTKPPAGTEYLFHEVDALGDNLLIACVRAGDVCADVLYELVKRDDGELPLFDVHHNNTDGYTALHVACSLHSAASPKLHTVHVLLQHGEADIWKGDVKGGDTAAHLAINSPTCDLRLVMIMFRHIDRKMWKKLAHAQNRSSVTPLEYARSAIKSTTRQNYPHEVLEFLMKCR